MGVTAWLWRGEQYIIGRYLFCYCLFPKMAILRFVGIYKNLSLRCLVLVSLSMPVTEARLDHFYPSKNGDKHSGGGRIYPASDTGWRREDFRFPEINSVDGDSDKRTGTSKYPQPWSSYPPPIPLWALTKPRRVFHPYFGKFSLTHNPDVITSSPTPSTTLSSTTYTTPSTTPSTSPPPTNSCRPDPVTDNLPWDCIDIIQALRDGENLV